MIKNFIKPFFILIFLFFVKSNYGQTSLLAEGELQVTAKIEHTCYILDGVELNFGSFQVGQVDILNKGYIRIGCTVGTSISIRLDKPQTSK